MISQYFTGGMMPDRAIHNNNANKPRAAVAKSALAEARRLGSFRGLRRLSVYCGPNAREEALSYAPQRAGYDTHRNTPAGCQVERS